MQFADKVANPDDMIKFHSLIAREKRQKKGLDFNEDAYEGLENVKEFNWFVCKLTESLLGGRMG